MGSARKLLSYRGTVVSVTNHIVIFFTHNKSTPTISDPFVEQYRFELLLWKSR